MLTESSFIGWTEVFSDKGISICHKRFFCCHFVLLTHWFAIKQCQSLTLLLVYLVLSYSPHKYKSKSRCTDVCSFDSLLCLSLPCFSYILFPYKTYSNLLSSFKVFLKWNMQSEYWVLYFSNIPLYLVVCPLPSGWNLWKPHLNNNSCTCIVAFCQWSCVYNLCCYETSPPLNGH